MDPFHAMERILQTEGGQKLIDRLEMSATGEYKNPAIGFRLFQGGEVFFNGVEATGEIETGGEVSEDERGFAPGVIDSKDSEKEEPTIEDPLLNEPISWFHSKMDKTVLFARFSFVRFISSILCSII